jgi:myosin-crossreactive antigen
MGFTKEDRLQLVRLAEASEVELAASRITDWLSPGFFHSKFWYMWATTFAFQPWHSAVEFKRYLHRFMKEFTRIETLAGVKRTIFNQYDALVQPLESWLAKQGVRFLKACTVTNLDLTDVDGKLAVTGLTTSSPPPVPPSSKNLAFIVSLSRFPKTWCSRLSTRFGSRRWPSTSCSASRERFRPFYIATDRSKCNSTRFSKHSDSAPGA